MALDSIILECRSVRVGTLRRMVTKPVIVSCPAPSRTVSRETLSAADEPGWMEALE